jgi:hypothetical protein
MNDDGKIIADNLTKGTIFRPSFINQLQYKLMRYFEKFPKGQKYRLVVQPITDETSDEDQKSFTEIVNEYLEEHKPTEEQLKEDIALLSRLSPKELKEIMLNYVIPKIPDDFIIPNIEEEKK